MTSITQSAPGRGAAWAVLIGMGVTSVTYNVFHAVHGARLEVGLALLLGLAPAYATAFLSHVVAVLNAPWWIKAAVLAVVVAGMVLSASAVAAVVQPAEPGWRGWLFGLTLDGAALLALWAILDGGRRKAAAEAELQAAHEAVQQARAEATETAARAIAAADEAAGERSRLEAELALVRAELGAQLDTVRAELEAVREAERLRASARKPARRSGRKRTGNPGRISAPATAQISGTASGAEDDIDAEAAALNLWLADSTIPGSKLGPMVGRTDSWGRAVVRKWKAEAPQGHPQEHS